ncbi:MAG: DUF4169 family protein [Alphaproteobacteria bacterium]|nr:DUF4169 family protein [Alphaproteobacteria bacterium]
MAEIVNLNQFRKARQKADKDTQAARNRVRHGRRKDDRQRRDGEEDRRRRDLDGRHLGDDAPRGDEPA